MTCASGTGPAGVFRDRIQAVTDPVNQGRYAGRFEVRDGDNPIGFGDRAEVQLETGEHEGADRWYAWSTMFDPSFPGGDAWPVVTSGTARTATARRRWASMSSTRNSPSR